MVFTEYFIAGHWLSYARDIYVKSGHQTTSFFLEMYKFEATCSPDNGNRTAVNRETNKYL